MYTSIELFAGAGGLGLGTELAGFQALKCVEWDRWACETIRRNVERQHPLVHGWSVHHGDVREVDYTAYEGKVDLVSGGPPCQPFSMGGKHRAHEDDRDMFSAFATVVATVKPRAFIIENVKGLTRAAFANYLQYIELRMEMPEIAPKADESWHDHLRRLERENTSTGSKGIRYNVQRELFNSANFGAPQKRERVFIVGFRDDLNANWSFPDATHSYDELLRSQWVTGEYWDEHKVAKKDRGEAPRGALGRIAKLSGENTGGDLLPWRTVRDALKTLPEPNTNGKPTPGILNHQFQGGARVYKGHTGSPIDMPSKALKAGVHGVPGGENMLVRPDGSVRYFTVREAARMQTFPDSYQINGAWSEAMRQIGNAVPVVLAERVARSVALRLHEADFQDLKARSRLH